MNLHSALRNLQTTNVLILICSNSAAAIIHPSEEASFKPSESFQKENNDCKIFSDSPYGLNFLTFQLSHVRELDILKYAYGSSWRFRIWSPYQNMIYNFIRKMSHKPYQARKNVVTAQMYFKKVFLKVTMKLMLLNRTNLVGFLVPVVTSRRLWIANLYPTSWQRVLLQHPDSLTLIHKTMLKLLQTK